MKPQLNPAVEYANSQLQWILDHASGGEFRRVIIERIEHLRNNLK